MGSRSKRHGLTGISHRRPKSNVNTRNRKNRLNERKQVVLNEIGTILKTPEL